MQSNLDGGCLVPRRSHPWGILVVRGRSSLSLSTAQEDGAETIVKVGAPAAIPYKGGGLRTRCGDANAQSGEECNEMDRSWSDVR